MQKHRLTEARSMQFVAIDVETANADMSSICQIGLAKFVDGHLSEEWSTLVDPEDYFDDVNISMHGIEPGMVKGQPKLPQIADRLGSMLEGTITVCHTHFDRIALGRAFGKYNLSPIATTWLDSARVVRRTWKDLAWKGYGLANVCSRIGYEFLHHDALEDAKAAGFVLLAALRESQLDLEQWHHRINQPIDPKNSSSGAAVQRDGNPEGDLYGEVLVFTGELELPRSEAADLAASVGCHVAAGVTKKTTIIVVGDQDITKLAGYEKSSKHRKAEQLIAEGRQIRIIRESDFKTLVRTARNEV
jgi:DNA polymerase III subunit epsilon